MIGWRTLTCFVLINMFLLTYNMSMSNTYGTTEKQNKLICTYYIINLYYIKLFVNFLSVLKEWKI